MTAASRCRRRWCACVRRRTAERRCCRTRCGSSRNCTSSTGSRIRMPNYLARLVFPEKTREFKVESISWPQMAVFNPFDFFLEPGAETFPFRLRRESAPRPAAVPRAGAVDAALQATSSPASTRDEQRTIDFLVGAEPASAARDPLPDPARAGRADAGADAEPSPPVRAATPGGCWCRCCASWAWPRASCPAT